jgi:hypothetical protein
MALMKFAYADPPYFTQGKKRYGEHHPEAEIWDDIDTHINLIKRLITEFPDGWALSSNPADLKYLLIDNEIRVCVWVKTFHQIRPTTVQYAWEPVLLYRGRKNHKRKPMVRDWISGVVTRRKGLPGAKPDYFNQWILDLLNYQSGDELIDIFPGTNGMAEALAKRNV